jgi:hypothetical protein
MWVRRIAVLLLALALVCGGYATYFNLVQMRLSPALLGRADAAFAQGIAIQDAANDFVDVGGKATGPDNAPTASYPLSYVDIKTVQVGADVDWLYFKVIFQSTIPSWPESYQGDLMQGLLVRMSIREDPAQKQDSVILVVGTGWEPLIRLPASNTYFFWGPTGIEEPESQRYAHQDASSKLAGGAGTDYLMGALPMKKLGLALGQTIYFTVEQETKSARYTHASFDALLGEGKASAIIRWVVGSADYRIVPPEQH